LNTGNASENFSGKLKCLAPDISNQSYVLTYSSVA